jgi:predicted flavoprotein YhiN
MMVPTLFFAARFAVKTIKGSQNGSEKYQRALVAMGGISFAAVDVFK